MYRSAHSVFREPEGDSGEHSWSEEISKEAQQCDENGQSRPQISYSRPDLFEKLPHRPNQVSLPILKPITPIHFKRDKSSHEKHRSSNVINEEM